MAWIFVGVTLFLGLVLAIITKIVYPLFTQVFEAYDNLNNSIKENITNMRVVKSYVKEQEETDKFRRPHVVFTRCSCVLFVWLSCLTQP